MYNKIKLLFTRRIITILCFLSLILFSSCATIISGSKQKVQFASDPSYAKIFIDGVAVGRTPFEIKLERNKEYRVLIQLKGYQSYETTLTQKINGWFFGNILLGGLIGLIVDPITGAMYKLTPKEIYVQMGKQTAFKHKKSEVYVAVALEINKNWKTVGQLEKTN